MKRISQLTELTTAEATDELPIREASSGQTKRISVKNLTGLPDLGWTATGETHSFSSFSSTTKKGVITVPSDATLKYTVGQRYRFTQATGGTKYGRIIAVTATSITIRLAKGVTLNNEAITSPVYSSSYAPAGYRPDLLDTIKAAFAAYHNTGGTDFSTTGIVPFSNEYYDFNNDFTTGAGANFTCPVDGFYQFNWVVYTNNNTGRAIMSVNRSGTDQISTQTELAGKSISLLYYCLAGDIVRMQGDATQGIKFYGSANHNTFSGALIQEI